MSVGVFVGLATLDVIQHVEELPRPDAKVTATWQGVAAGGPALNAAVTFAALGGSARLITRVGSGPVADLVRADLAAHGVELVDVDPEYTPSVSSITVLVGSGERQIVSTDAGAPIPLAVLPGPALEALAGADVVELDGHHPDLAELVLAQTSSRPSVLDAGRWKPQFARLVPAVDDIICSAAFAFPGSCDVLGEALARGVGLAAVSAGGGPLRWRTADACGEVVVPAVEAVDTLGAGDVLHGAYAYARCSAASPAQRLRFASDIASRSVEERGTRTFLAALSGASLTSSGVSTPAIGESR